MTYDKYRDWSMPGTVRPVIMGTRITLEEQVLKDLDAAKDEADKLDILDSFAAYHKRAYRQDFAESAANVTGQQLGALLAPIFLSRLPDIGVIHRGRRVPQEE